MSEKNITAQDIRAPEITLTIGGKDYKARFDMTAYAHAEVVYHREFKEKVNIAVLISELADGMTPAIMAVCYGAIVSGGSDLTWSEFKKTFTFASIPAIRDALTQAVTDSLPDSDETQGEETEDPR